MIEILSNVQVIKVEDAANDSDFRQFIEASSNKLADRLSYLMFFKTECVHEGVNGNGIRFFDNDLKGADKPFLFAPVKWEHGGPIIGTVVASKYKKVKGKGLIEVKGVLWTVEKSYAVQSILEAMALNPEAYKTSLECFYDPADKCDYGIGDNKISYNQFQKISEFLGRDYNGRGIVWKRANNPIFVGLAFTDNPADIQTDVSFNLPKEDAVRYQMAYASITGKENEMENSTVLNDFLASISQELSALQEKINNILEYTESDKKTEVAEKDIPVELPSEEEEEEEAEEDGAEEEDIDTEDETEEEKEDNDNEQEIQVEEKVAVNNVVDVSDEVVENDAEDEVIDDVNIENEAEKRVEEEKNKEQVSSKEEEINETLQRIVDVFKAMKLK